MLGTQITNSAQRFILLIVCLVACNHLKAAEPYTAVVIVDSTEVLSGPGQQFYATDRLNKNDVVEVYHQSDNGYAAIRPPRGSYSWLPAKYVELTETPNIGKIKAVDLVPMIGSKLSGEKNVHQIKLKIGELVEIIEAKKIELEENKLFETWYKIKPPAGEFRWVKLVDIEQREVPYPPPVEEPKAVTPLTTEDTLAASESQVKTVIDQTDQHQQITWRAKPKGSKSMFNFSPIAAKVVQPKPSYAAKFSAENKNLQPANITKTIAQSISLEEANERSKNLVQGHGSTAISPESSLAIQLTLLEMRLSQEVLKTHQLWSLTSLKTEAKQLLNLGSTPLERGQARLLLEKIQQFEELKQRKESFSNLTSRSSDKTETDTNSKPEASNDSNESSGMQDSLVKQTSLTEDLAEGSNEESESKDKTKEEDQEKSTVTKLLDTLSENLPIGSGVKETTEDREGFDPRFDGKGWLMPVIKRASAKQDGKLTPPYALTDEEGNVLRFVSPAPGINLHRYLKQEVGIYGQMSTAGNFTRPHLTAHRVIVLNNLEKK